jgi:hypothetical protein
MATRTTSFHYVGRNRLCARVSLDMLHVNAPRLWLARLYAGRRVNGPIIEEERSMNAILSSPDLLRRTLRVDAIASGGLGLIAAVGANPLAGVLGLHPMLLRISGIGLIPFAAALLYLASRPSIPRRPALAVVIVNLLWVVDSVALLVFGWAEPTALGYVFVAVQAVAVLVLADLEYVGLRRAAA